MLPDRVSYLWRNRLVITSDDERGNLLYCRSSGLWHLTLLFSRAGHRPSCLRLGMRVCNHLAGQYDIYRVLPVLLSTLNNEKTYKGASAEICGLTIRREVDDLIQAALRQRREHRRYAGDRAVN